MPIDDFVYIISDFRMFYTILPFFGKVVFRLERFVAKQKLRSRLQSALQSPFRATFKEATFRHRRESSERALERAVFFFPVEITLHLGWKIELKFPLLQVYIIYIQQGIKVEFFGFASFFGCYIDITKV